MNTSVRNLYENKNIIMLSEPAFKKEEQAFCRGAAI